MIEPGYWLAYFHPGHAYEIVYIHMNCKSFDIIGSDISYDIESKDYSFIKKINIDQLSTESL